MRRKVLLAATLLLSTATAYAEDDATGYGEAFVDAFARACVPERLSYEGTRAHAESLGWVPVERSAHPELATMMTIMDAAAKEAAEEMDATFDHAVYGKAVADVAHYLVVSRSSFVVDFGSEPEVWARIGCYLYNFDATAPIDPAPVTALLEKPISHGIDQDGLVSYVWGPPCPMPRTGDTYMTFLAEDSPHAKQTGFTGLMIKFETSEPDEGEEVPETYCTDDTT